MVFGRPVIGLELVDPRHNHLDTALAVLDGDGIMYHPEAVAPGSRSLLETPFPGALPVSTPDAAFGLNAVSDGLGMALPEAAERLTGQWRERGLRPIGIACPSCSGAAALLSAARWTSGPDRCDP